MSQKHFIAIAATIAALNVDEPTRSHVAESMADTLSGFNSNFKRGLFLTACFAR